MNVLMSAFASSPDDKIFTVLPELPTQHLPGLPFFRRCSAPRKKNRLRYLLNAPRVTYFEIFLSFVIFVEVFPKFFYQIVDRMAKKKKVGIC